MLGVLLADGAGGDGAISPLSEGVGGGAGVLPERGRAATVAWSPEACILLAE